MRRIAIFVACSACMGPAASEINPVAKRQPCRAALSSAGLHCRRSPLQVLSKLFHSSLPEAAFATSSHATGVSYRSHHLAPRMSTPNEVTSTSSISRASVLHAIGALSALQLWPSAAQADEPRMAYQPELQGKGYGKTEMDYPDFEKLPSGLKYKDGKKGTGKNPEVGDRVVLDWSGYTIGYFGRPFETKTLRELDKVQEPFLRFELGAGTVIPALEQGVRGMAEGGIRQLVVPGGAEGQNIGYPTSDPKHDAVGPKPSTFSGQQALNFVLENKGLVDKTLLFNIKLIRVDKKGTFQSQASGSV